MVSIRNSSQVPEDEASQVARVHGDPLERPRNGEQGLGDIEIVHDRGTDVWYNSTVSGSWLANYIRHLVPHSANSMGASRTS